jgi:hypothetical protein
LARCFFVAGPLFGFFLFIHLFYLFVAEILAPLQNLPH